MTDPSKTAPDSDGARGIPPVAAPGASRPVPVGPHDGSADLLRRALPLMSRYAAGYAPESYALWYEYVRGSNPQLRAELDETVRRSERLSTALTFELHQKHLGDRGEEPVREAGAGLLELMNTVKSSVEVASTNANEFDAQLLAFDEGIASAESADDVRQRVTTMRDDVTRMNRSLAQLNERLESSRREVEGLQVELRKAREEASLDPLSGVLNRRGFELALVRACEAATADGSPLCLIMLDIDFFKKVNDTFGHPFGDQVIRGVGQALSQLTQRRDVAARYGGEEFALLLPDTPVAGAFEVAERIRAAVARGAIRRASNGAPIGAVTISAGVAQLLPGELPESLVLRADRALYASKQAGRDRVTIDA